MKQTVCSLAVLAGLFLPASVSPGSSASTGGAAPHPPAIPGVSATAAGVGGSHTCALTPAGGVKCWGDNTYGQLGDGSFIESGTPVDVAGLTSGVVAIAAGGFHTCALTSAGDMKCWGRNDFGQVGDGTTSNRGAPVNALTGVSAIAAGETHTCAVLSSTGGVKCWGDNTYGQLGDGTGNPSSTPTDVSTLTSGVSAVTAGGSHTCALTTVGGVKCWGANFFGQLGDSTTTPHLVPNPVTGLDGVVVTVTAVTAGDQHTCALTSGGALTCWGFNGSGRIGDGTATTRTAPTPVTGLSSGVIAVSAGNAHTCAVMAGGGVKCWGNNDDGELGDGTRTSRLVPTSVPAAAPAAAVDAGRDDTCILTTAGGVQCWGTNTIGQLGVGPALQRVTAGTVIGVMGSGLTAGLHHSCVRTPADGAACWGRNIDGQLGDGTYVSRSTAAAVSGLIGVVALSAGDEHTCALTSGGGVKCWGANAWGQLGDGTTARRNVPGDVSLLGSGVAAIASGALHTCAVMAADGAVKCWGFNFFGQLGDGTTTEKSNPQQVLTGAIGIAAGYSHTCALMASGAVKCWGDNSFGQLGDGTTASKISPPLIDISSLTASAITAGGRHTCALTSAGAVTCWGDNSFGQVGAGTLTTPYKLPVGVSGLSSGVVSVDAGDYHTCAVAGTAVQCWGHNPYGQLGDGTMTTRNAPVAVSGAGAVATVSGGGTHSCVLLVAGGVQCWGADLDGQLGVGRMFSTDVPLSVIGFVRGATPILTDDPLVAGATAVKAVHINELRALINHLRPSYALAPLAWTDPTLTPGVTAVKAVHVSELRTAVAEMYIAAGSTPPTYTVDPIMAGVTTITAAQIAELRAAMLALW